MFPYTASDIMCTPVTIDSNTSVLQAEKLLKQTAASALCVAANGHIYGIFHNNSIFCRDTNDIVADYTQICKHSVVAYSDLSYILQLMQTEQLQTIWVAEQGKIIGLITNSLLKKYGFLN